MRITERDVLLVKDLALSHVLSRDQILSLKYFSSVTRANTRLRELRSLQLVRRIETPFFGQSLYAVGAKASDLVGRRIAPIIAARSPSPRFLQHALMLTNARIRLMDKGATAWRFEQQLRSMFRYGGKDNEIRPDGFATTPAGIVAVEVDMGHVAPAKFKEKLRAFDAFVASGECERQWHRETFTLLVLTPGAARAASLARLQPSNCHFSLVSQTFAQFGIAPVGGWS